LNHLFKPLRHSVVGKNSIITNNYIPMKIFSLLFISLFAAMGCSSTKSDYEPSLTESMYFPSNSSENWETKSATSLGWNANAITQLKDFLNQKNSKAFIILVNGRIVMEEYFDGQLATDNWEWNSAGKTLVAATVGIAQHENLVSINKPVSDYIGIGWTNEPLVKERMITSKHLLSMTSGLNDTYNLVQPSNLTYVADAGTRWSYHNVFQKLIDVVSQASNKNFETYFDEKLKSKIGMQGYWNFGPIFKIYHSNARSMARFGLLALNKGTWKTEQVLDSVYFKECIQSSQNINPSYGYLWWLNGKTSSMYPGGQTIYQGSLVPNAPSDMFAAMGANDQRLYVIPSKKMVIVRMGNASDPNNPNFAVSGFDNELWRHLNEVINK